MLQSDSQAAATTSGTMARGIYVTLTGLAELAPAPELATKYTSARDHPLPQGTSVVQWSYTDKMGEAELIAGRRTPETDAVLAGVFLLDQSSALDALETLIAAGRTLSQNALRKRELEQRRAALAEESPLPTGCATHPLESPGSGLNRRGWLRSASWWVAARRVEPSPKTSPSRMPRPT